MFGLYASSAVTAVANDAAQRAASSSGSSLATIEADARSSLGRVGDAAEFSWTRADEDGDGAADTIVLTVVARPPRLVPTSVGRTTGFGEVRRTVHARIEAFSP